MFASSISLDIDELYKIIDNAIFLGIDLGSSSVKVTLFDGENGVTLGDVGWPQDEMPIVSRQAGWAEQDPELWWQHTKTAIGKVCEQTGKKPADIAGIGIAYQMHGLVRR